MDNKRKTFGELEEGSDIFIATIFGVVQRNLNYVKNYKREITIGFINGDRIKVNRNTTETIVNKSHWYANEEDAVKKSIELVDEEICNSKNKLSMLKSTLKELREYWD